MTVSWSINTLDEAFRKDMDSAVSIERRIAAMKQVYDAGIRAVCFVAPVFPGITDFEAIFRRVRDQCDLFWLENLNLRGGFKGPSWTTSGKSIRIWCHCMRRNLQQTRQKLFSRHWSKARRRWQGV